MSEQEDEIDEMQCNDDMNDEEFEGSDLDGIEDEEPIDDCLAKLIGHSKDVFCLALSSSKRWLASGSEDDTACIWDLDNQACNVYIF